jgi:hypothetical protein
MNKLMNANFFSPLHSLTYFTLRLFLLRLLLLMMMPVVTMQNQNIFTLFAAAPP